MVRLSQSRGRGNQSGYDHRVDQGQISLYLQGQDHSDCSIRRGFEVQEFVSGGFERNSPRGPVSYTHLDVYKRQAIGIGEDRR